MPDGCDDTHSKQGRGAQAGTANGLDLVSLTCSADDPRFIKVAQVTDVPPTPIGNATELEDSTIVLHMSGRSGVDLYKGFSYKKDNPAYNRIANHLDGIKPGETRPI